MRWGLSQTSMDIHPQMIVNSSNLLVDVLASCIAHRRSADRDDNVQELDCVDACCNEYGKG